MVFLHSRLKDETTTEIIRWLICQKKNFFRLNTAMDISNNILFTLDSESEWEFKDIIDGRMIRVSEITSFFFNNGHIHYPFHETEDASLNAGIAINLSNEVKCFLSYLLENTAIRCQFGLSPFNTVNINKLYMLREAKKAGLTIPQTAVVSTKQDLIKYKNKWGRIITKNIDYGITIDTSLIRISGQRTEEVTEAVIDSMNNAFGPSLIQKLIEKQFEIRTYYFSGIYHSIAIFSQGSEQTKIDCRNTDSACPIRLVPFRLPEEIARQIGELMNRLKFNYGSIDLLFDTDGNYHFLEVNPFGQFGFLSRAGNYHIERAIAHYLN